LFQKLSSKKKKYTMAFAADTPSPFSALTPLSPFKQNYADRYGGSFSLDARSPSLRSEFQKHSPSQQHDNTSLWVQMESPRQYLNINDNSDLISLVQTPIESEVGGKDRAHSVPQESITLEPTAYSQTISAKSIGHHSSFNSVSNISTSSSVLDNNTVAIVNRSHILEDALLPRAATTPALISRPALTHFVVGL
jgi:hypothetical protein